MTEETFGFDAFAGKWIPPLPAWKEAPGEQSWRDAASEDARRQAYMETMRRTGGEGLVFSPELEDKLKRDAEAGTPIMEMLDDLIRDPAVGDREKAAILYQRVFGVPASRARFIASWQPSNRSREAQRILERVTLCVEDARRAGLWCPRPEA